MSKNYGIDGDDPDELVFYEDDIKPTRTKPKKKYRRSREIVFNDYETKEDNEQEERTVYIKEFDLNSIPPQSVNDKSGVKIVMIGKPGCFAPGTEVLMFDGSIKKVEDVVVGDKVMGDDGSTSRTVQKLYHDNDEMFRITPNKGDSYTVNRLHDLVLIACRDHGNKYKKGDIIEISVEEYLKQNESWKHTFKIFKCPGVTSWEEKEVNIDPYFLGVWLGDGTSANINITNIDEEIINYCENYAKSLNLEWNKLSGKYRYSITSEETTKGKNSLLNSFKNYNLINNKHIPTDFKVTSRQNRLELLAGIIDTDGHLDRKGNYYEITQKNETLANDILFLARSLGFCATKKQVEKSCMYKDERKVGVYYRINIFGININDIPVKVHRKQITREISEFKNKLHCGFKVESVGQGEYYGFGLDGNRRFCLASFEVVKNTGKSTVIQDIIASKAHITPVAQIFSGTEDSNHFYSERFPGVCVFNKLDEKAVENFVTRQKAAMKYLENPWAIQIIDDCTDDPKILTKPLFQSYYKNGRHWKMIHILSLQYCLDIRPNIRTNIDYTFILRETNLKNRKSLHENYAGCIDNFQDFCDIMDQITEDYTALVINNRVQSNKIEDCVFWYKAKPDRLPPNWKFGHPSAWDFHFERLDTNFQESFT
jgi:hypothetical protein